ncbi:MAG: hypothetical protein ABR520_11320 [Mycobacteriales bacterium]|nr:hypothetical protein [Actinomycetota bacterium]
MRRKKQERVNGPYPHGNRWRITIDRADGERSSPSFATEAEAITALGIARAQIEGRTIASTVDAYVEHCRARGLRSVVTIGYRLAGLLQTDGPDRPLSALTPELGRELWKARCADVGPDTQFGELGTARRFAAWCRGQGWLAGGDPFAGLVPTGPRRRGKKKLRIDEARRYAAVALAEKSEAGLAAAMALLMGMRAGEIAGRAVRDVDDRARVLWIERAKTPAGDRALEVPRVLRAPLAALAAGRRGDELLFGGRDRHWVAYHVRRLCAVAKVPEVCPHGLRGTQATISAGAVSVEHVAAALGQIGPKVTRRHYLAPGAEQDGRTRAMQRVLHDEAN